jgi:hypothetical protein
MPLHFRFLAKATAKSLSPQARQALARAAFFDIYKVFLPPLFYSPMDLTKSAGSLAAAAAAADPRLAAILDGTLSDDDTLVSLLDRQAKFLARKDTTLRQRVHGARLFRRAINTAYPAARQEGVPAVAVLQQLLRDVGELMTREEEEEEKEEVEIGEEGVSDSGGSDAFAGPSSRSSRFPRASRPDATTMRAAEPIKKAYRSLRTGKIRKARSGSCVPTLTVTLRYDHAKWLRHYFKRGFADAVLTETGPSRRAILEPAARRKIAADSKRWQAKSKGKGKGKGTEVQDEDDEDEQDTFTTPKKRKTASGDVSEPKSKKPAAKAFTVPQHDHSSDDAQDDTLSLPTSPAVPETSPAASDAAITPRPTVQPPTGPFAFPPFPALRANELSHFTRGIDNALSNLVEDHTDRPSDTVLELIQELIDERPIVSGVQRSVLRGAEWVYYAVQGVCEDGDLEGDVMERVAEELRGHVEHEAGAVERKLKG